MKEVKRIVNCILENGAYSNKNEKTQMAKGMNNYNPAEKILVEASWKFRRFHGVILQNILKDFLSSNKEFMDFLKEEDEALYESLQELKI